MFDPTRTYQKSAQGAEAIATRSAALTPKLRSLLILVDGKRSHAELGKLGAMLGDVDQLLGLLADQGFIEPAGGAGGVGSPAATPPVAAAPPAPLQATVPLAQAQRHAVRRLNELLGPGADDLCMRIEATRNAQEFALALQRAEALVRQARGEKWALQFAADMALQRPG